MRVYIGCGLTHVPRERFEDYTTFIHGLASKLRERPHDHEVRYALVDSDPQLALKPFADRARLCYLWDRSMVEHAELMIAEATYPSIGLGVELQIAEQAGKPIVIAFQKAEANKAAPAFYRNPDHSEHFLQLGEGYVSLMALGLPNVTRVVPYHSAAEGYATVLDAVEELNRPAPA